MIWFPEKAIKVLVHGSIMFKCVQSVKKCAGSFSENYYLSLIIGSNLPMS